MISASVVYLGLIGAFVIRSLIMHNYEFLFYAVILSGFWGIIMKTDARLNYPALTLWLLTAWLATHLFGGTIYIGETRLYDLMLIQIVGEPYNILKYDQLIHFFCYLVMTRFVFIPVSSVLRSDAPIWLIGMMTILAGSGIGAINEMVEFAAVVAFDAGESVGGYTNTALDIVCNTIGAVVGWITLIGSAKKLQSK